MVRKLKPWDKTKAAKLRRKVRGREPKQTFLIVCEGEKTEPNYFNGFRVKSATIKVEGLGANTISLVRKAIQLAKEDSFDQVWCVFDRDSFPTGNFNAAIALAKRNDIKVAYSNQSFELWYLLNFNYYQTAITRASYISRLHDLLGHRYEKNSATIYEELKDRQQIAIDNAKRLLNEYKEAVPEQNDPSTTVHCLVEELNKFID